jgi:hypothetical protein
MRILGVVPAAYVLKGAHYVWRNIRENKGAPSGIRSV